MYFAARPQLVENRNSFRQDTQNSTRKNRFTLKRVRFRKELRNGVRRCKRNTAGIDPARISDQASVSPDHTVARD